VASDFVERARTLLQAGQAQEAVRACRLGLLSQPTSAAGRTLLAEALLAVGRADDALAEARLALQHDPEAGAAMVVQARVLVARGELREAMPLLERAAARGEDVAAYVEGARAAVRPSSTPIGGIVATSGEFADPAETKLYPASRRPGTAEIRSADVEETIDRSVATPREPTVEVAAAVDGSGDHTFEDAPVEAEPRINRRPVPLPAPDPEPEGSGFPIGRAALVLAIIVVGAAVGFLVRALRFDRALDRMADEALRRSGQQTFSAYLAAEADLRAVAAARPDDRARGALRRLRAAMTVELGVAMPADTGERSPTGRDADAAAVYLALADGDVTTATNASRAFVAAHPDDGEAAYLVGRALLLGNDPAGAVAELERAAKLAPRPLTLVTLAEAHAARARPDAALPVLDEALRLAPGHPAALLLRARLLAAGHRLPPPPDPEAGLQGATDLSPAQAGWSALVLAEVALARGDTAAASKALDLAASKRPPRDLRFGAELTRAHLAAGRLDDARAEASLWAQRYPGSPEPRLWSAETALGEGAPDVALAELERITGTLGPEALVMRARALLALAQPAGAARDLDRALVLRPGDRIALGLRAEVDVQAGDFAGAVKRLEPVYRKGENPEIALLYGGALRRTGDRTRAAQLVDEALAGAQDPATKSRALTEKGRLATEVGKLGEAQEAFTAAITADPSDAAPRIESALLALARGDSLAARTALDKLVTTHGQDPDVLLESARLHALRGDRVGAAKLVDLARRRPGASPWRLAREAGRLALDDGRASEAAQLLEHADHADGESRLLRLDALIASAPQGSLVTATKAVRELEKDFAGRAEVALARGRLHLAKGEGQEAVRAFSEAVELRIAEPAPPRLVAEAKTWLGRGHDYVGDLDASLASYAEAVKLDPSNAFAHYYRGRIQLERGQVDEAHDSFERAVANHAGIAQAYFHLGETAAKLGKPAARQALLTYLKLAPDGEMVVAARALLKKLR
jgi:tetratricopeptide (TPR) repeat protein